MENPNTMDIFGPSRDSDKKTENKNLCNVTPILSRNMPATRFYSRTSQSKGAQNLSQQMNGPHWQISNKSPGDKRAARGQSSISQRSSLLRGLNEPWSPRSQARNPSQGRMLQSSQNIGMFNTPSEWTSSHNNSNNGDESTKENKLESTMDYLTNRQNHFFETLALNFVYMFLVVIFLVNIRKTTTTTIYKCQMLGVCISHANYVKQKSINYF